MQTFIMAYSNICQKLAKVKWTKAAFMITYIYWNKCLCGFIVSYVGDMNYYMYCGS